MGKHVPVCVYVFSACGDTGPHLCWLSLPGRGPPGSPGEEKLGPQSQGKGGMWSVAGHGGENHALPGVSFPGLPAWPQTAGGMRISKPRLLHGAGGQDVGLDGRPACVCSGRSPHHLLPWAVTVVVKILAMGVFFSHSESTRNVRMQVWHRGGGQEAAASISHLVLLPLFFPVLYSHEVIINNLLGLEGLPGGASGKELACQCRRHEMQVRSLGGEDPLEGGMASHSSILAWSIHG